MYVSAGDFVTIVSMDGGSLGWVSGRGFKQPFQPPYNIDVDLAYPKVEVSSYQQPGPASTFTDNANGASGVWSYVWFNLDVTPEPSPPVSTFVATPSDTWATTDVSVNITSVDNAQVKEVHYKIGSAAESVVPGSSASFTLSQTGIYDITYFAVDNLDNLEAPKYATVRIDKVKPVSTLSRSAGMVSLFATDAHSGISNIKYRVDNGPIQNYTSPIPTSAETITYFAEDIAGNREQQHVYTVAPGILSLALSQSRVPGGIGVVGTVTLDKPAALGGTVINLASSLPGVAVVDATITVPEGATDASFYIDANPVAVDTVVSITATCDDTSQSVLLSVLAPTPVMFTWSASPIVGGATVTGTLIMSGPSPTGGTTVSLASTSLSALVAPSVTISAGAMTTTFIVTTKIVSNDTSAVISATVYGARLKSTLPILAVRVAAIASVQVTPSAVLGSQSAVGRVNLTTPAPAGGLVVDLTSSNSNVIVPATVRVVAGETFVTFDVLTKSVTAQSVATLTATVNSVSRTTTLTLNALVLQNVSTSSSTVVGGNGLSVTVTLNAPAPTGGVSVALSSNNTAVTVPATVTVAAGQTTATADITTVAVTSNTSVTLTATLLGVTKTAIVTLTAPSITRLSINPSTVVGGNTSTATVDITSPAPAGGLVIALASNRSDVLAPVTVTVPAGQNTLSVLIPTRAVLSQVDAVVTATLNGVSRATNLTLTAPALTSVALNPSMIRGGEEATLTVQLTSLAPASGVTVALASTNSALILPASVTVPAGETTVKSTLATRAVTARENGQLTATFAGVSKSVQVSVLAPVMASLTIEPNAVVGGTGASGTLELSSVAPNGGLVVSLASNRSGVVVPATITIPAGSTTVSFAIQTSKVNADVTASITATLNGNTRSAQIRVVAHQLATLAVIPSSVSGGSTFTGRVTLQQAAPAGGIVVSLASSDPAVSLPATVTIDAGKTTATFAGTTAAVTATKNVTITASLNGNSVTDTLRVVQPGVKSIALSPSTVTGGTGSQLTVTLDAPAPVGGWLVNLASSDASTTLTTTATIAAGQTNVTGPVTTKSVLVRTPVSLTATDASGSQTTTLVVEPVVGLQLRLSSTSIAGGNSVNLTVELAEAAPKTGATVALSADNAVLIVPVSLKVLAGSKTATLAVKSLAVSVDTTVRIAGTVNGYTDRAQLVVTAPRPQGMTFAPAAVLGGKPSTGTLRLTGLAPVGGLTVHLSSDNAAATVPATVLVPAGKNVATFVVTSKAVTGRTLVNISASANGTTVSQQLAVQALTVQSVVLKPGTVVGGTPSIGTVTLNGVAPAGGLLVDLTSSVSGVTVPAKVFVPAGKNIVTFTATTEPVGSNVEATLTARANGDQAAATLLVTPVLVSSLTVAPTTVVGGTSATGTVKLAAAPGIDTVVMLSSGNPTIASVPATVVVKQGTLTATFTVTTKKPAAQTTVTLSAVTGGVAKSGKLTVKP